MRHLESIEKIKTVRDLLVLVSLARGTQTLEDLRNELEMGLLSPISEDATRSVVRRMLRARVIGVVSSSDPSIHGSDGRLLPEKVYQISMNGKAVLEYLLGILK